MPIGGLQKLTLLDFPAHVACTVFLQGCNFRCPFCHNTPLLVGTDAISEEEVFSFLRKRQGLLDGVAITGGEPLLSPGITEFIRKIKALGYQVKLDTNGSFPQRLRELIDEGLVDYVAMDIKNSREKYAVTAGTERFLPEVEESISLLLDGKVDYEFRTTVVDELHEPEDFAAIGQWIQGAKQYFLQGYVDSGDILVAGLTAAGNEKMAACRAAAQKYVTNTQIRGIE